MRVAVCIVAFRNPADVSGCLAALAVSSHGDFEVVVCENGGEAAFGRLVAALPGRLPGGQAVRVIEGRDNPGYAGGVNLCIAAAPGCDAWWVLNPDTKPAPDALAALLDRLARGDVQAVGGTLHFADGTVQADGGQWRPWLARSVSIGYGRRLENAADPAAVERRMSYILGASLLAGRRFLDVVGPMREDYFLYGEEVEWCLRGRRLGMRLGFAPGARVLHLQGTTTGSIDAITRRPRLPIYLDERNKLAIVRDTARWRLPLVAPLALALLLLRFARRGAWRQTGYALSGWLAGLRDERGKPRWLER